MPKYIVQAPMPISFDVPRLNITNPNIPHTVELTEHEVRILSQSVPNIKIVLVTPPAVQEPKVIELEIPKSKRTLLVEVAPSPEYSVEVTEAEETTIEPIVFEPPFEPAEETVQEPIKELDPNRIQSSNLSLKESVAHLQTLKTIEDIKAFVSVGDTRVKLLEEVEKRSQELSK